MNTDLLLKKIIVFFFDFKREKALRRKALKIMASCTNRDGLARPASTIVREYKALWRGLSRHPDIIWLKIYGNVSGIWDHRYVPENIYYNTIEPCLNNKAFSKGYTDKNFYHTYLGDFNFPPTVISNVEGVFYNNQNKTVKPEQVFKYLNNESRIIIKPAVDSGGGHKVTLWRKGEGGFISNEGTPLTIEYLTSVYKKNFIIQEVIDQHSSFGRYNPTSVNTVRVLTYRSIKDEGIKILHCVFRVGVPGSITDNQASGGYACGITDHGRLTGIAIDKMGNRYNKVNDIDLIPGTAIEGFEKILSTSRELASRYQYSRLLGLDLCLDTHGEVRVLEVNNVNNEINFFQMMYGPLFKSFTEEVVAECSARRRSFLIDFDI